MRWVSVWGTLIKYKLFIYYVYVGNIGPADVCFLVGD